MFDQLFKQPCALSRQRNAPLASERASFLAQRAEDGAAPGTLVRLARELLVVVQELDLANNNVIIPLAIEAAADHWARHQKRRHRAQTEHWSRIFFQQTATNWLRFLGRLYIPEPEPKPFASLVERFANDLQYERGLSSTTIANYQWHIERFLTSFSTQQQIFAEVSVADIDVFLARQGARWCRVSIATSAKALRAFFRYAEAQQWCRARIAAAIESPRLFRDETLPAGPAWEDVQQIIPPGDTQQPRAIRDLAILLLFTVYGLRSSEVAKLQLEDIDWSLEQLTVPHQTAPRPDLSADPCSGQRHRTLPPGSASRLRPQGSVSDPQSTLSPSLCRRPLPSDPQPPRPHGYPNTPSRPSCTAPCLCLSSACQGVLFRGHQRSSWPSKPQQHAPLCQS